MNNKVTIIIPTYNRPDFLERILEYYQTRGSRFNFIIGDSSTQINKRHNKKIINSFSKLKILYIDKFPQNLSQHDKFAKIVQYVKTKYCVFCADDDFIIPAGIKKAADFLEKNQDYSAAHGSYISFYVHNTWLGSKKFWWRSLYSPHSISLSNPIDRIYAHLTNYTLLAWAVQRTDIAKICHNEFLKTRINPYLLPIFGELVPDCLVVLYGKVKHLNNFYAARQSFSQILSSYPSLADAKASGKYEEEYNKFKQCLIRNLKLKDQASKDKAASIINSAIEKYIDFCYQEHILGKINKVLNRFPKFLSNTIKTLHAMYLFSRYKGNPTFKYLRDFENIRRIVLKHNV